MRLAMLSDYGSFAGILPKLEKEGIEVGLWIREPAFKHLLNGITKKFDSLDAMEEWNPDLCFFDGTHLGSQYKRFSGKFPCFNGNPQVCELETDRQFGLQMMLDHDIEIPPTFTFKSIPEAIAFLEDNKKERYVFKQSALELSSLTMLEKEPGTLKDELFRTVNQKQLRKGTPCILQQFIEGDEIDYEAWVVNGKILHPLTVTLEEKKAWAGNLGPATGASSAFVWCEEETSKIAKQGILRMAPYLERFNFNGQIALNSIVANGKVYGLEFTCRPGINASFLLMPLFKRPLRELFDGIASKNLKELPVAANKPCAGLTFSVYPYPLDLKTNDLQGQVMKETCGGSFFDKPDGPIDSDEGFFWCDAVCDENKEIVCGATQAIIGFNARAESKMDWAMQRALEDAELLKGIACLQYRNDGCPRAYKTLQSLESQGMIEGYPK